MKRNYIELFAGCGGLSLGLESEDFELVFANELSPMAAETFAYNHLGLKKLREEGIKDEDPIYWISSTLPRDDHKGRLSENPFKATGLEDRKSDVQELNGNYKKLSGSLLVGSILDLNALLAKDNRLRRAFKSGFKDKGHIDIVSGGPPCQGFSMAGMRIKSDEKNSLPWAFAEFVKAVKPRIALLENVTGILRPFKTETGQYYAWHQTSIAFAVEGYVPICLHVNAKYAGAAQNRPRFIMIALEKREADTLFGIVPKGAPLHRALENSRKFYRAVKDKRTNDYKYGTLRIYDLHKDDPLFDIDLFEPLRRYKGKEFSVRDAIDDVRKGGQGNPEYLALINDSFGSKFHGDLENHFNNKPPDNNSRVKSRFRLYQVLAKLTSDQRRTIKKFIRQADPAKLRHNEIMKLAESIDNDLVKVFQKKGNRLRTMTERGSWFHPESKEELVEYLVSLHTKKQTQRALIADQPAPAALSIPDDACHYREVLEQRTLTVREMARFQSFPDSFVFRSKVTTGGQMRRFQVPQYTQVGNAVPPLLGKALGEVCNTLLDLIDGK